MIIKYENKYGCLEIEIIEKYHKVSEIYSKNYDNSIFFSIEIAEQITLITDNVNIQCACVWDYDNNCFTDKMMLVHHQSGNIGAVCKIIKLNFAENVNPEKEIEQIAKINKGA